MKNKTRHKMASIKKPEKKMRNAKLRQQTRKPKVTKNKENTQRQEVKYKVTTSKIRPEITELKTRNHDRHPKFILGRRY